MLLQTNDYDLMTPEPQTDEEPGEKTGLPCFLNLVVSQCVKLVAVNLLFLIGCIPIVTIPLSLYAMNQAIHRMIRGEPVKCFQSYRKSFRYDWKKGYIAFLLTLLPLGGAGVGMWFYFCRVRSNPLFFVPFLVCSTTFLVTLVVLRVSVRPFRKGRAYERNRAFRGDPRDHQASAGSAGSAGLLRFDVSGDVDFSIKRTVSAFARLFVSMFSGKFLSENGIEYFRKNLGLSQEELAERSGLGYSTVSRIESAASYPLSIISFHRIANALEAEPYRLLTFKETLI